MHHQIGPDPTDLAVIYIRHLTQGGDPGITGTAIPMEDISHPTIITGVIADAHGHAGSHTEEHRLRTLPRQSIIMEGEKSYVYKISNENIADKTEVKIGIRKKGNVEILSGLKIGDVVAAEGLKKVRPKGKIKPIKK